MFGRLIWLGTVLMLVPGLLAGKEPEKAKPAAEGGATLAVETAAGTGRVVTLDVLVADLSEKLESPTAAAILEREKAGKLAGKMAVKLAALENQTARVQFGETVARATGRTIRAEGGFRGGGVASYSDVQVGTVVQAIARIEDDGSIVVDLKIERSGLASSGRGTGAGGAEGQEQLPQSVGQLSLATTVKVKAGEPTIVGGRAMASGDETAQTWIVVTAQFAGNQAPNASDRASARSGGPVNELRIFTLRHASAPDLATVLVNVFAGQPLRITAEPRTNSILVVGPAANIQTAQALLTRLDEGK
jgi:type II secretory pathway component GspD/PulD (secretin)